MDIKQELKKDGEECLAQIITKITKISFLKGETPEQAVEMITLVSDVFEVARAFGKAESSAEIFEMLQVQG